MVKQGVDRERRVAIVTGAGTGLGRAYALDLARSGVRVLVNNRRREVDEAGRGSADRVVAEIVAAGGDATANGDDVCDDGAGERMVRQALDTWGRLDALVNNAGVDQHAGFHKIDLAHFRAIFEVNFFGTVQVTHAAWTHMRNAGHGRVLVSTSSAGLHGLHAYAAAKAALIGLARSLAAEGASRDVYCNAIAPYAATRMTASHVDEGTRRAMSPDLVAPLVTALVRADSHVNGQVIVAGKGWARRATTVELDQMVAVTGPDFDDACAQLTGQPVLVGGVCRSFSDALEAYGDFADKASERLRTTPSAE
jgi:NAD(P)-dependent dehydrogenase (short-subunit alcohol dehydrogenase family)